MAHALIVVSFGWYGKYVMPAKTAAKLMEILAEPGTQKIDNDTIEGLGNVTRPVTNDVEFKMLDDPLYLADCPKDKGSKDAYFAYIKMKRALVGDSYVVESYAQYLEAKSEAES